MSQLQEETMNEKGFVKRQWEEQEGVLEWM